MSTSSQYYRNASAHPHYHDFPANNQEHLYALAASSWQQDASHTAYTDPPYLHYGQGGADPVSHAPPAPTQTQTWPAGYARQDSRGWAQPVDDLAFASRTAVSYDAAAEGSALVLQPRRDSEALQQHRHQQTLHTGPGLTTTSPRDAYSSIDRDQGLRTPSVGAQWTLCRALIRD
jgi:hypothetical protein